MRRGRSPWWSPGEASWRGGRHRPGSRQAVHGGLHILFFWRPGGINHRTPAAPRRACHLHAPRGMPAQGATSPHTHRIRPKRRHEESGAGSGTGAGQATHASGWVPTSCPTIVSTCPHPPRPGPAAASEPDLRRPGAVREAIQHPHRDHVAPGLAACNLVEDNLHTMQVPALVNPGVGGPPSLHRWAPTRHKHVPQGG